ncbi:MAG: hypothetical protein AAB590_01090 [Patescibacteria group bacterium]
MKDWFTKNFPSPLWSWLGEKILQTLGLLLFVAVVFVILTYVANDERKIHQSKPYEVIMDDQIEESRWDYARPY